MTAVGVPLIVPFDGSNDRPAGSAGEIDHEEIIPPLAVGVTLVIAVPFVNVNELGLYVMSAGGAMLTWMVRAAEALPPVLVAVTV